MFKKRCVYCNAIIPLNVSYCGTCQLPITSLIEVITCEEQTFKKKPIITILSLEISKTLMKILRLLSSAKSFLQRMLDVMYLFITTLIICLKEIKLIFIDRYVIPLKIPLVAFMLVLSAAVLSNAILVYDNYIIIKTVPSGTDVHINGIKAGLSPVFIKTKGKKINLELNKLGTKKGFKYQSEQIRIKKSYGVFEFALERELYPVPISTTPHGVQTKIYRNNTVLLERTINKDITINLEYGSYRLEFYKDGYQSRSIVIQVPIRDSLIVNLKEIVWYGTLEISISPWAKVYIDGELRDEEVGPSAISFSLKESNHILELKQVNESTQEEELLIRENIVINRNEILSRRYIFGVLVVSSLPSSILFIDNQEIGRVDPSREILLLEGTHILELKEISGTRNFRKEIYINPLTPLRIHIRDFNEYK